IEHAVLEVERDLREWEIRERQLVAERLVVRVAETGDHATGAIHRELPRLEFTKFAVAASALLHRRDVIEEPGGAGVLREERHAIGVVKCTGPVAVIVHGPRELGERVTKLLLIHRGLRVDRASPRRGNSTASVTPLSVGYRASAVRQLRQVLRRKRRSRSPG